MIQFTKVTGGSATSRDKHSVSYNCTNITVLLQYSIVHLASDIFNWFKIIEL